MKGTVIIGVGNDFRGDDAAGLEAARALLDRVPPGIAIRESRGEALSLMDLWSTAERVILVDATRGGESPGEVRRWEAESVPLPTGAFGGSTHDFGLSEAIELARSLDRLPARVVVYGIEGACFENGRGLSEPVRRSLPDAIDRIGEECGDAFGPGRLR